MRIDAVGVGSAKDDDAVQLGRRPEFNFHTRLPSDIWQKQGPQKINIELSFDMGGEAWQWQGRLSYSQASVL